MIEYFVFYRIFVQTMPITLIRLYELDRNRPELLKAMQQWKLIPTEGNYKCPKCSGQLTLQEYIEDGWRWQCNNKVSERKQKATTCGNQVRFRTGTFFAASHLTFFQILGFGHLWAQGVPLRVIKLELSTGSNETLVNWASFCREVVFDAFLANPVKLGGPGVEVEIDESKFGRRKYHRGHPVEGQWIFGGYERGTGRIFMVAVEDRKADTLLPIIKEWIHPGTTIISDFWRAYDCLNNEGYEHYKVNHSLHFKDPDTQQHTNAIESSWRAAKAVISASGRRKAHIPGNLARYLFNKRCDHQKMDRTEHFYQLAGEVYNPAKKVLIEEGSEIRPETEIDAEDLDLELLDLNE